MKHCEIIIPEFGIRLKKALKHKRLTQRKLCQLLDVDKKTVNSWCNDYFYPNIGYLKQICEILGVSADYLLELEEEDGKTIISSKVSS